MRILLFLATNFAILAVANVTLSLLGFDSIMQSNGVDLDLKALLIFCALFGFGGALISLMLSKWLARRSTGAKIVDESGGEKEQWLSDTVAELARDAGIGMPQVAIFPSQQANAFATGWNRNKALVAVSQGMLDRYDRSETRAVMAHEIGHVANGDMVTMTLIQGVINTFVMFIARIIGHTVDRVVFKNQGSHGIAYFITVIVTELILAVLASTIVMWFSRWREFRADAAGARLVGSAPMIAALESLRREHEEESTLQDGLAAFAISGSWKKGFAALFATHPPLEKRIEALRSAAG